MDVRRNGSRVEVFAPAKLNLFLEVLGRRADGYHEIETLMVPISLGDTLYFEATTGDSLSLDCRVSRGLAASSTGSLPTGSDNLVLRAVELLRRRAAVDRGARLVLVKRIPLAAGLAGGSSDAAAALVAANESWELGWSRAALAELSAELGSDIPFFFGRGAAVCRGRGERVEPLQAFAPLHAVVARPPAELSTAAVYRACKPAASPCRVEPLCAALATGRVAAVAPLMRNRLQPPAEALSPWIARMRREFERLGVLAHQMSGSGTSYFGLVEHARRAQHLAARLRGRGVGLVLAVRSRRLGTC